MKRISLEKKLEYLAKIKQDIRLWFDERKQKYIVCRSVFTWWRMEEDKYESKTISRAITNLYNNVLKERQPTEIYWEQFYEMNKTHLNISGSTGTIYVDKDNLPIWTVINNTNPRNSKQYK